LSLEGKKGANGHNFSSHANRLACLWKAKGADDHNLSPRVNGLACLWKAKRVWMTIICLCVPTDSLVSGKAKGENDHNLSPRADRLACL